MRARDWPSYPRPPGPSGAAGGWKLIVVVALLCISATTMVLATMVDLKVRPSLAAWAKVEATTTATKAINNAIRENLGVQLSTENLVIPLAGSDRTGLGFTFNVGAINAVESQATRFVTDAMQTYRYQMVPFPLGQVTGLSFLGGWGPRIPINLVMAGGVSTDVTVDFRSAGINNVMANFLMQIDIDMQVIAPFITERIPVHETVPLASVLIPGPVPQTFLGFNGSVQELSQLMGSAGGAVAGRGAGSGAGSGAGAAAAAGAHS